MSTADKLREFLADESNFVTRSQPYEFSGNGFGFVGVRRAFECADGTTVSIQQSASHYCTKDANTFELWNCPRSELLAPYGEGVDPYAHVPFDVVVAYIDSHGGAA